MIPERRTRSIHVRDLAIGGSATISVQSMAATRTLDVDATVHQVHLLEEAGADLVRIAVDSAAEVESLARIRSQTNARLVVDLQESYRLAERVAPYVDKIRYNPGHLHHHEKQKPVAEKVAFLVDVARRHDLAMRIGVNAGSVAPAYRARFPDDEIAAIVASALDHCALVDEQGFDNYLVSIKDSDPRIVIEANQRFAEARPDVPLHLGVTEAGLPPDGVVKTRIAFEQLLSRGIGDTIRVSLTVPFEDKGTEVGVGRAILADIEAGRFRSVPPNFHEGLNIIACPSCSRVENERFIELAQQVAADTRHLAQQEITIAVMGCRVNGPGETDDADLGLWCGPNHVNLKRGPRSVGTFSYQEILPRLHREIDALLAERGESPAR